jgi:hypothetical protein
LRDESTQLVYIDDWLDAKDVLEEAFAKVRAVDLRTREWEQEFEALAKAADVFVTDLDLNSVLHGGIAAARDGRALTEVIRSVIGSRSPRPLYTIFSGKLDEAAPGPYEGRLHVFARDLNADWVGRKQDGRTFPDQLVMLCEALRILRTETPPTAESIHQFYSRLFGLKGSEPWVEDALEDVDRFQPPVQQLFRERDEPAFLRWLTRTVLPYPSYFIDASELAIKLRLDPGAYAKELSDEGQPLGASLAVARYRGVLADFLGPRWWRVAANDWLWTITNGRPYEPGVLKENVLRVAETELPCLDIPDPVLLRDEWGRLSPDRLTADASECVRFQPEDWPAIVAWPWMLVEEARRDPVLRALVLPQDEYRLAKGA